MTPEMRRLFDAAQRSIKTMEAATDLIETQKRVAALNAEVSEASSTATMAAAQTVAEALDRNTASSTRTGKIMVGLTAAYVLLTLGLLVNAWVR